MEQGRRKQLHLLGLCSQGGVHSQISHLYALLEMAKTAGRRAGLRALLHGRPRQAARKRHRLHAKSCKQRFARSASARSPPSAGATTPWTATSAGSASRRLFAPWCSARAIRRRTRSQAMQASYDAGVTDEFVDAHRDRRRSGQADRAHPGRRRGDLLQLPRRPRPADDARAERSRASNSRRATRMPKNLHFVTMTRVRQGIRLSPRAQSAPARANSGRGHLRAAAGVICGRRRPKNIRT